MQRNSITPGVGVFAFFVFVLLAAPKTSIKIGPLPIYLVDVLIFVLIISAQRLPKLPCTLLFSGTIMSIAIFVMLGEIAGMLTFGTLLETTYITGRTLLAISVFFLAPQYIRTLGDLSYVLKAIALGLLVTALLMILTSLPATRGAVGNLVFSHGFLEPAAGELNSIFEGSVERGIRGRTLVGVSILGASFINASWPLSAILLKWPAPLGIWRTVALSACILAPMGVLMSYSRGPIIGSILIIVTSLLFGLRYVRRGVLLPVTIGAIVVASIGIGSQIFYFERLEKSTRAILDNPQAERQSERLNAYSEPFQHVIEHPRFLFIGEGVTARYSQGGARAEQAGQATHAVFAMSYYAYGMIAAFLYISLIARGLLMTARIALSGQRTVLVFQAQALFLSILAVLPWALLGHAAVSAPRGAMLFFLIFGMTSALPNFATQSRPRQIRSQNDVYSRLPSLG